MNSSRSIQCTDTGIEGLIVSPCDNNLFTVYLHVFTKHWHSLGQIYFNV